MGQSTDAIIGWGYAEFEEGHLADIIQTALAELDDGYEWDDDFDPWDAEQEAERAGVTFGTHCSCEYPMLYVTISDACKIACRGGPERLSQEFFEQGDTVKWAKKLHHEMEKMGVPIPDYEPGWFICSDWC